jgi:hypothetical protein
MDIFALKLLKLINNNNRKEYKISIETEAIARAH